MGSSYLHSMTPCTWLSNRKDAIWKDKSTIYTPNKEWHGNLSTWTPCNPPLQTHSQHPSIFLSFFCKLCNRETNTSFRQIATWNWFTAYRLLTNTKMLTKDKHDELEFSGVHCGWKHKITTVQHRHKALHSATAQCLNQSSVAWNQPAPVHACKRPQHRSDVSKSCNWSMSLCSYWIQSITN